MAEAQYRSEKSSTIINIETRALKKNQGMRIDLGKCRLGLKCVENGSEYLKRQNNEVSNDNMDCEEGISDERPVLVGREKRNRK